MAGSNDKADASGEMTVKQYAAHRGVSNNGVHNQIQNGKLDGAIRKGAAGEYRINPELADKLWVARGDSRHLGKMKSSFGVEEDEDLKKVLAEAVDFNAAKAKEKKYQAEIAKMNFEERSGQLVEKKLVQEKLFEMARKIRNNLLNIPSKIMDVLAAETEPYAVEKILNDEIKKTLEDLADELN